MEDFLIIAIDPARDKHFYFFFLLVKKMLKENMLTKVFLIYSNTI